MIDIDSRAGCRRPLPLPLQALVRTAWLAAVLWLSACGVNPYHPTELASAGFLQRAQSQTQGPVTVRAAVPDAAETRALTGLDLYGQGIQPLWLEVSNRGDKPLRATFWSIDRDYFSPIEVAYMNRRRFSAQGYRQMEQWFHQSGMARDIPPGESRSGLVYTHLSPGTKGFNFDLFGSGQPITFTFFLALPGFTPDYMRIDFDTLYAPGEIREVTYAGLTAALMHDLPCCASNAEGEPRGGPLNIVLVGTPRAVRRSLMRGGWLETPIEEREELTEQHRFQGRVADGRFYMVRHDDDIRLVLRIWLSPWRVDGLPVWVAQSYYREEGGILYESMRDAGVLEKSALLAKFVGENVFADIDSARNFVHQNLWYNQSLERFTLVPGVGFRPSDAPGETYDGLGYFTDGLRSVLFVSETPVAMGETVIEPPPVLGDGS
jgi:hypothetical protein